MQNEEFVHGVPGDRLAAQMPDPSGPPQPVKVKDPVLSAIAGVGVACVAIGGLMLPMIASTGHTSGATRSAKLRWEYRQRQIEQATQEDQSDPAQETTRPVAESDAHDRTPD